MRNNLIFTICVFSFAISALLATGCSKKRVVINDDGTVAESKEDIKKREMEAERARAEEQMRQAEEQAARARAEANAAQRQAAQAQQQAAQAQAQAQQAQAQAQQAQAQAQAAQAQRAQAEADQARLQQQAANIQNQLEELNNQRGNAPANAADRLSTVNTVTFKGKSTVSWLIMYDNTLRTHCHVITNSKYPIMQANRWCIPFSGRESDLTDTFAATVAMNYADRKICKAGTNKEPSNGQSRNEYCDQMFLELQNQAKRENWASLSEICKIATDPDVKEYCGYLY